MNFFRHQKIIFISFICWTMPLIGLFAMQVPQISLAEQAEMQREFEAFENDIRDMDQDLPALQAEYDEMEREANAPPVPGVMEKVLIQGPSITMAQGVDVGVALNARDVVVMSSWLAEYGLDWYLAECFKKFSVENVSSNLLEKHEEILFQLNSVTYHDETHDVVNDVNFHQLNAFFKKEFFIDLTLKRMMASPILAKIIVYFLSNECLSAAKYAAGETEQSSLVKKFFSFLFTENTANNNNVINVSLSTVAYPLKNMIESSILSRFLSGYSDFLQWAGNKADCRNSYFDSYFFQLKKRIFILVYFSRQISSMYQHAWINFVQKNAPELKALLEGYASAKRNNNLQDIELVKKKLNVFVSGAHTRSFFQWIRFKNLAFSKTTACIETVLALPLFYEAGKKVHQLYSTLNQH